MARVAKVARVARMARMARVAKVARVARGGFRLKAFGLRIENSMVFMAFWLDSRNVA